MYVWEPVSNNFLLTGTYFFKLIVVHFSVLHNKILTSLWRLFVVLKFKANLKTRPFSLSKKKKNNNNKKAYIISWKCDILDYREIWKGLHY